MMIDFHAHPGYGRELSELRVETAAILQEAAFHGVSRVCMCSIADWKPSPTPQAVRKGNDTVLGLMREFPEQVIGFCYLNPIHTHESRAELERCLEAGMQGIKLWIACKISDARAEPIVARAAELGLPILQHCTYGNPHDVTNTADAVQVAARLPDAHIVLAHLMSFSERGLAEVQSYPNLHVDIAGGEPEAGWVERAVRWLGAERVLFGTDTPIRSYGSCLGRAYEAKITARERKLLLSGNAQRLLAWRSKQ